MATLSNMFMYSLTLVPSSAVTHLISGKFVGNGKQQMLFAQGSRLTLVRIEKLSGKWNTIISQDCFGVIRHLQAFRLAGSNKDYIIVGSDSGRIVILEYMDDQKIFKRVAEETYGKSGVRRVVPGQYLAADPKGRAVMVASIEKNKLVYVLNRDTENDLRVSSPLEAHKHYTLVFDLVGVDVGYENPIFAALEVDYEDSSQDPTDDAYNSIEKELVYYELDLGLNHVVRKWTDTVPRTAHKLFTVPGGVDGPGGVLVCAEESISYHDIKQSPLRVPIPRRSGAMENPERKRFIVSGSLYRSRGSYFFILQTEDGDLFKAEVEYEATEGAATTNIAARRLVIKYFGTVPVASNLVILSDGWLYVATEAGDHAIYYFESRGDDDDRKVFTSDDNSSDPTEPMDPVFFDPLDDPEYLSFHASFRSLNPITGCKVADLVGDDSPQIYTINGSGARSTFRTLRHGLEVTEVAASGLPRYPSAVWTTKMRASDDYDSYIVMSFPDSSFVLKVSEEGNVEETDDTSLITHAPTIAVQALEDAILQIHPRGIRHIRYNGNVTEWPVPSHRTIVTASTNERQVALALSSGELVYFEVDGEGNLNEFEDKPQMSGTVTALSIGDVPEGRVRSSFLAVGCDDSTVRVLSLDPDTCLDNKSIQAVSAAPTALRILSMHDSGSGGSTLYLHIGLSSGVYLRTVLDEITGDLSDTRTRFLGAKPVKLFKVTVTEQPAILALASHAWLGYSNPTTKAFMLTPLNYEALDWAWSFSSAQCQEGIVGLAGDGLRIVSIDELDENLIQESIPLRYTPKAFARHPEHPVFYVGGADMNTLAASTRRQLLDDQMTDSANGTNGKSNEDEQQFEKYGYPRGQNHWASCIQVVDPVERKEVLETIDLEQNEAIVSMAVCPFTSQDDEAFLVVGTGQDMKIAPKSSKAGYLHVYRFKKDTDGRSLEFVHKTAVELPPYALLPFQGRILVGLGTMLRVYDLGMKQLLRKAQNAKVVPTCIVGLQTQGPRIVVSDVSDSVTYVTYRYEDNKILPFADDSTKRWTTATTMLDYQTTAGGDKFGNFWIVRCPPKASQAADEDNGVQLLHQKGYLLGAPDRLELMVHFYVQDIPKAMQRTALVPGGREVLLWAGIQGTIGIFVPFVSRDDVDFFQKLEGELRQVDPPLAGRDHLMYRGYYAPVKGVIDGDLVERYLSLKREVKERIAEELDRSVREVERRIQDMRTRVAF